MDKIQLEFGVFLINTVCTLKCKKCLTMTPYHDKPVSFVKERIFSDIDAFFQLVERVVHLDFEGGETLLHPDIAQIVDYALRYQHLFDRIHLLTNGTLLPKQDLLDICQKGNVLFLIDDYGPQISIKKDELCEILAQHNIRYRIDTYWGDRQYFGGWIDQGDAEYKNYAPEQLEALYRNCRSSRGKYPYIKNGWMFVCQWQAAMMQHIPLVEGEYVDLRDMMNLQAKMDTILSWWTKPVEACKYCNSFNVDGLRIPAAEQLTEAEWKNLALKIARSTLDD